MHYFIIHSSICELLAHSIIENNNLNQADVVFFLMRSTKAFGTEINSIDITNLTLSTHNSYSENNTIKVELNRLLQKERFDLYVPNCSILTCQFFIRHQNCNRFWVYEEGTDSYQDFRVLTNKNYKENNKLDNLKWFIKIKVKLGLKFKIVPFVWHKRKSFQGVICQNSSAFPGFKNKIKVKLKTLSLSQYLQNETPNKVEHLIVLDALVQNGLCSKENYFAAFCRLLQFFKNSNYTNNFFKLHPASLKDIDFINKLNKIINNFPELNLTEFKEPLPLEFVHELYPDIKFYTTASSLALYTGEKNKVYTFKDLLMADKKFRSYYSSLPNILISKMSKLDEIQ